METLEPGYFLSFSLGNKVYNLIRGEYLTLSYSPGLGSDDSLYRFIQTAQFTMTMGPGDQTDMPRASLINDNNYQNSTQNLENASYLRFDDIMLSYLFKPKSDKYINSLRLYFEVQNAFIFTKYSGFDPEVSSTGGQDLNTTGVDYAAYPKARTFLLGINLGF
jgi:hypothetical protein